MKTVLDEINTMIFQTIDLDDTNKLANERKVLRELRERLQKLEVKAIEHKIEWENSLPWYKLIWYWAIHPDG